MRNCGYLHTGGAHRPVSEELLHRMCAVMSHRGPDDEGIYTDGAFGMGMRRLSIIDLSSGQQPAHLGTDQYHAVVRLAALHPHRATHMRTGG